MKNTITRIYTKIHNIKTGKGDLRIFEVDGKITQQEALKIVREEFGAWLSDNRVMCVYRTKGFDIKSYIDGDGPACA